MVALSPLSGQNRFEPPLEPVGSGRRAVVAHGELARSAGPPRIVEDQPGQLPDADVGHRVSAFPQHTRAVGSHHDRHQACEEPGLADQHPVVVPSGDEEDLAPLTTSWRTKRAV